MQMFAPTRQSPCNKAISRTTSALHCKKRTPYFLRSPLFVFPHPFYSSLCARTRTQFRAPLPTSPFVGEEYRPHPPCGHCSAGTPSTISTTPPNLPCRRGGLTDLSRLSGTLPVREDAHAISSTPTDLPCRRGGVQTSPALRALLGGDAEHNFDHPSKPPRSEGRLNRPLPPFGHPPLT